MRKKMLFEHFDELRTRKQLAVYLEYETPKEGFFIMVDGGIVYQCRISKQRSVYPNYMAIKSDEEISAIVKVKDKA